MQPIDWGTLDASARRATIERPRARSNEDVTAQARAIIEEVRVHDDEAVRRYTVELDGVALDDTRVTASEFAAARNELDAGALAALRAAIANVETFHRAQVPVDISVQTRTGVLCERVNRPIHSVGLYVPAGSAPLPSTVIMLGVPAMIAGCPVRVLCTPPQRDGSANAAVLVAAELCGIDTVFKIGGAQAIAAMAYGTARVPKVLKIFGPGNAWVTAAKQLVAADPQGAALDLPAGPSEVMVIADETARAEFVAADLLAQAEHDPAAQALLVTTSMTLAREVATQIGEQLTALSRRPIITESLRSLRLIVVASLDDAVDVAEQYAPEHLLIQTRAPRKLLPRITNAGSVFLGHLAAEALGDYCSGANHVLPTYGYARAYSGLSVGEFTRSMTVQEVTAAGIRDIGPTAIALAELEGLDAHAASVQVRLAEVAQ